MADLIRMRAFGLLQRVADGLAPAGETDRDEPVEADAGRRLRVLMLPDATAGNPYQRSLTRALQREGVDVHLAQPRGPFPLLGAVLRHRPMDVLHLHWTHRLSLGRNRLFSALKALRFVVELAVLRAIGIRIVWTAHNLIEHERRFPRLELWTQRAAARAYDRIIVHGPEARRVVAQGLALPAPRMERLRCVPHGHFIGAYPDHVSRAEARRELGIPASAAPVFVHFGQIRPYKGVWELLDAFRDLDLADAVLVIAGKPWDAATDAALRERATRDERVKLFSGFVPDERIQYFMTAADAVVLPYRHILTSGTAMLAMSFARTVIMPRYGCSRDMLGTVNGLLYDPGASDGLRRAMERASATDLVALGAACRDLARHCDWSGIAAETAAVYRGGRAGC